MAKKREKRDWVEKARGEETPPPSGAARPVVTGAAGQRLEAWALYVLVLLCGAGLMSLEMVGARVLWNNFGSSVFVWGSIISVFMAALACGYWGGGLLADRRPEMTWLAGLVAIAGAIVLTLTYLGIYVCNAIDGMSLGARMGPLAASAALYFLPGVLLGAVSPFAVRLQARKLASMGNVAGRLYALGTLGSLLGTLLTTFVLIPALGTSRILYLIGVVLLAAAMIGTAARFAARGGPRTPAGKAATATLLLGSFLLGYFLNPGDLPGTLRPPSGVRLEPGSSNTVRVIVDEKESAYHVVSVVREFDRSFGWKKDADGNTVNGPDGKAVDDLDLAWASDPDAELQMRFNNLIESKVYVNREFKNFEGGSESWPPATTYTKILHMGMAMNPEARKILIVGLGGGSAPREFTAFYPGTEVDVVEIDPVVVKVAREHFRYRDNERIKTYVRDGRQFLRKGMGRFEKYDLIALDAYSGGGQIPAHLVTREFISQCRDRLADGGVLVSNIISALRDEKGRFFQAEFKTMAEVFDHVYVFPSRRGDPKGIRNLVLVATMDGGERLLKGELVKKAEALMERYPRLKEVPEPESWLGAEAPRTLDEFAEQFHDVNLASLDDVPMLTDEYAPVETMFYWVSRGFGR